MLNDVSGLAQSFGALLKDDTFSDVTLVVDAHRIPAHRNVLAARSDYFRTMFTTDLAERRNNEVILNDTSLSAFQPILNYAYTGTLNVEAMDEQTLLEVLELSHRYQFPWVQNVVATHLAETVTINTVCEWLNIAELLNIDILKRACLKPTLAAELLQKQELVDQLSSSALESILALDSVPVSEIDRFRAVCGWIEKHQDDDAKPLLSNIRLSLLTEDELYNAVRPTNYYSDEDLLNAVHNRSSTRESQPPAQAIEPQRQTFDSSAEEFIMKMCSGGRRLVINTIQLTLPSHLDHYSYEVDVSSDDRHSWSTICGQGHCERQQTLYIAPQRATDLRIRFSTGTIQQCTPLTVVASYSDGVVADFDTDQQCRGYKNKSDVLFDGNMDNFALFSPNDPTDSLVVRFSQPYYVSSLVFLLSGHKSCWYSYYVEVSDDNTTWNRVCDKSTEKCRGWQAVRFAPQRVVYVRIVGTRSFRLFFIPNFCVAHFECPVDETRLSQLLAS